MSLRWFENILAGMLKLFVPFTLIFLIITLGLVWFLPWIAYLFFIYILGVSLAILALSMLGMKVIKMPRMGEAMILERGGDPSRILVGGEQHADETGNIQEGSNRLWFEKFGFTIIFPWESIYVYSYKYDIEKSLEIEHKEITGETIFSLKDKNYGFEFKETEGQKAQFSATFTATCALVNILTFYGKVNDGFYVMRDKLRNAWLDFSSKNYDLKQWLDASENPDGSGKEGLREKVTLAFFRYLMDEKGTKISSHYDRQNRLMVYKPYEAGDENTQYNIKDVSYIQYILLVTGILIKSIDIVDLNTGEAGKELYKKYINQLTNEAELTLVKGQQDINVQKGVNEALKYQAVMEGKTAADNAYAKKLGIDMLKIDKAASSGASLLVNIETGGSDVSAPDYSKKAYRNTKAIISQVFDGQKKKKSVVDVDEEIEAQQEEGK